MARYKAYSRSQGALIPVHFKEQIQPGTFEHALDHLIDKELDLSPFDARYDNDTEGAPAYDPRILLKIILLAYSRGITSSRKIASCCEENVLFMALSANSRPHFTTIANFISSIDKEAIALFQSVLLTCDQMGLIGKEMFAIDGCKISSNASKEWSGTTEELKKKAGKMKAAIERMVDHHRSGDKLEGDPDLKKREEQFIESLRKSHRKIRKWLDNNEDKIGKSGKPIKSNITDNDSAKMKTSKGVIQGYNGVTVVDGKHQVIVSAEAFGQVSEHDLLKPMIDGCRENFAVIGHENDVFKTTSLAADAGFHSRENVEMLHEEGIDGYVADNQCRKRDPRFADADRYRERTRKELAKYYGRKGLFKPADFTFAEDLSHCLCPAGKRLYRSGAKVTVKGKEGTKFNGPKSACGPCKLRLQCLRYPDRTPFRQVVFFRGLTEKAKTSLTEKMKEKIDSAVGRIIYGRRLAIAEPPFANICSAIGLKRFSLRGKKKVNAQWNLFCVVHNLLKIQRYGEVAL